MLFLLTGMLYPNYVQVTRLGSLQQYWWGKEGLHESKILQNVHQNHIPRKTVCVKTETISHPRIYLLDENGVPVPVGTQSMHSTLNVDIAKLISITFMASGLWLSQKQLLMDCQSNVLLVPCKTDLVWFVLDILHLNSSAEEVQFYFLLYKCSCVITHSASWESVHWAPSDCIHICSSANQELWFQTDLITFPGTLPKSQEPALSIVHIRKGSNRCQIQHWIRCLCPVRSGLSQIWKHCSPKITQENTVMKSCVIYLFKYPSILHPVLAHQCLPDSFASSFTC